LTFKLELEPIEGEFGVVTGGDDEALKAPAKEELKSDAEAPSAAFKASSYRPFDTSHSIWSSRSLGLATTMSLGETM
jgi:hypothetical protein